MSIIVEKSLSGNTALIGRSGISSQCRGFDGLGLGCSSICTASEAAMSVSCDIIHNIVYVIISFMLGLNVICRAQLECEWHVCKFVISTVCVFLTCSRARLIRQTD